jgi:hypothetical protein
MPAPFEPRLEFSFTVRLTFERAFWIRPPTTGATRASIYVKDGAFEGPAIRGIVVPGSGADWPLVRPNGVIAFDARYLLQVDDGTVIYLQNRGFRWGTKESMDAMARNEPVDPASYYFRTTPRFEAPEGSYDWLNKHVFIGIGEKVPRGNHIHYYKLL